MEFKFDRVKEGDLITSKLMNDILAALESLDGRCGATSSSPGFLGISDVSPQPAVCGKLLTVTGGNFGIPQDNVIILGEATVDVSSIDTSYSNASTLVFYVPNIQVPDDGFVWLSIANPKFLGIARKKIQVAKPVVTTTGTIEAKIVVNAAKVKSAGQQIGDAVDVSDLSNPEGKISVYALDGKGKEYPLKYSSYTLNTEKSQLVAMFNSGSLQTGNYRVTVKIIGFSQASANVSVIAGQKASITLTPVADSGTTKPPQKAGPGIGKYKEIDPVYQYIHWPRPPEERGDYEIVDPDPEQEENWRDWVVSLADKTSRENPAEAIDPGNVQFVVDKSYDPADTMVRDDPYAFISFGEFGAASLIPVIATTSSQADVPLENSGMAGIDNSAVRRLSEYGIETTAQLAASWKGVVKDAMNLQGEASDTVAQATIQAAQVKATELVGSTRTVSGVTMTMETALSNFGIKSLTALANQEPANLITLNIPGIDQAFAERLVGVARQTVPESAWSLVNLNLNEKQISALSAKCITSLQSFGKDGNSKVISDTLAVTQDEVKLLQKSAQTVDVSLEGYRQTVQKAAPVTAIIGINRKVSDVLTGNEIGIKNVGQLALADADKIAVAFGGDVNLANAAIIQAKNFIKNA